MSQDGSANPEDRPDAEPRHGRMKAAQDELSELFVPRSSDRPWAYPVAIAFAAALPLVIGAWFGAIGQATVASIGAMTITYLPKSTLERRLVTIMAAASGMMACFALGQIAQIIPETRVLSLMLVTFFVTCGCRYYRIPPPSNLFFVIAASIGAYVPGGLDQMPQKLGIFALGCISAIIIGFFYSWYITRRRKPVEPEPPPDDIAGAVITDSLAFALIVGLALALAELAGFDRPYWVTISCLAVLQGPHLKAVWRRQLQRIIGTMVGLVLTAFVLSLADTPWHLAIAVFVLMFLIQAIVVRNYAMAAVFITPYAITLAEATIGGSVDPAPLMAARFLDTVLGSLMGLLGGLLLHVDAIRAPMRRAVIWALRLKPRSQ